MAVNIGPRIGIDGEAEYRKAIQGIIQETKTLKSEFEKISSDTGTNSFKKAIEQSKVLTQEIEAQQKRVQELQKGYQEAVGKWGTDDTKTQKWAQAVNEATTELNKLKAELDKIPNAAEIVGQKFQDWGKNLQSVGSNIKNVGYAFSPVSAAAAAGLTASAKSFMDFESSMSNVKAISGATGQAFDDLTEKAKEMGAKTKYSAAESADAFSYMAMAGWKAEDMLDGIEGVMNLAAASGEDLASTSDIVTDAITAFGLSAKDSSHFADILAATATNSNTNVAMMGETFKYVAPIAGSLGYTAEDTALAIGLMANAGIKSSQAGTSLRNVMTNLAKPTETVKTAMKVLGVSLEDAHGNVLPFRDVMEQLRNSFSNGALTQEEYQKRLEQVESAFNTGQLEMGTYGKAMEELNEKYSNGEINSQEYDKRLEEIHRELSVGILEQGDYEKALDRVNTAMYGVEGAAKAEYASMIAGKYGMSGLMAIISATKDDYYKLANAIDYSSYGLDSMTQKLDESGISWEKYSDKAWMGEDAVKNLASTILYNLKDVGTSTSDLVDFLVSEYDMTAKDAQEAVDVIVSGMKEAGGAAQDMADIMLDNAQGSWTIAKSALEGAAIEAGEVLAPYLIKAADAVKELANWFSSLSQPQQDMIVKTMAITAAIGPLLIGAGKVVGSIGTILSTGGKLISGIGGVIKVAGGIGPVVSNIGSVVGGVVPAISTALGGVGTFITGTLVPGIASLAAGIGSAIAAALPVIAVIAAVVAAGVLLYKNWDTIKEKAGELGQAVSDKWNDIKDKTHEAWENVKEKTSEAWENVKNSISEKINNAKDTVAEVGENIKNTLHDKWEEAKNKTSEAWNNIKDTVSEHINNAKDTVEEVGENIKNAISEKWESIKENTSEAWNNVKDTVSELINNAKDTVTEVAENIKTSMSEKWNEVKDNTKETWENIKTAVSDAIGNVLNKIREKMEDIKNAVAEKVQLIKDKVGEVIDFIKELPGKALDWGRDLMDNFISGIREKIDRVKEIVSNVADTVKNFLGFSEPEKGPLSNFHTFAPDMMELFAKGIKDNTHLITDQIAKSFDFQDVMTTGYGYIPDYGNTTNNSVNIGDTVINIYGAEGQSEKELAEIVDRKMSMRYASTKAAWA